MTLLTVEGMEQAIRRQHRGAWATPDGKIGRKSLHARLDRLIVQWAEELHLECMAWDSGGMREAHNALGVLLEARKVNAAR